MTILKNNNTKIKSNNTKIKKSIGSVVIISCLICSTAKAVDNTPYVFGSVGKYDTNNKMTTQHDDTNNITSLTAKSHDGSSPIFTVGVGHRTTFSNGYNVGLEVVFDYMNKEKKYEESLVSLGTHHIVDKVKINHSYGGYLTFGKKFDNNLQPYVLLGYKFADIRASSKCDSLNISGHKDKMVHGFSGGLGFNFDITEKMKLMVSGIYTQYSSFNTPNFDSDANELHKLSVKVASTSINVGVSYNFSFKK